MKEHSLNLNSAKRPVFTLTLMDEEETTIHVKVPSMDLFNELRASAAELDRLNDNDPEAEEMVYDLTARLLSCNRENLKVTAKELRGKYNLELEDLLLVYGSYMDFLADIKNEKN